MGKVEWGRGVDPGRVQRPDDIINFEYPFNWPSAEPTWNLGPSALIPVSICLEKCTFSREWPTERRRDTLRERQEGEIIDWADKKVGVDDYCVRLVGCMSTAGEFTTNVSTALGSERRERLESSREMSRTREPQWDAVSVNISAIALTRSLAVVIFCGTPTSSQQSTKRWPGTYSIRTHYALTVLSGVLQYRWIRGTGIEVRTWEPRMRKDENG